MSKFINQSTMLKTFLKIAELWSLSEKEQMLLLGVDRRCTFIKWKNKPNSVRFNRDKIERISLLLGIYKDLQILLPNNKSADLWIKSPNDHQMFGGLPPIDFVSEGMISELFLLRQHLARIVSK